MIDAPEVSVVVPFFDEEDSVAHLGERLLSVLGALDATWELVLVDDGSRDGTLARLRDLACRQTGVRLVVLARNAGQHSALLAGFASVRGAFVVTLDADLQNPPEEIPNLLAQFRAGHDLVSTVRRSRDDSWFRRRASSAVNAFTRRTSGIPLHDFGCMLRGYGREIVDELVLRGETRTFLPALAYLLSRRPVEIDVEHSARAHGRSKYSIARLFRLHLDLMTGFSLEPMRLLFPIGATLATLGGLCAVGLLGLRFLYGSAWGGHGTFTLFAVLFAFVGAQFVTLALIGEYVGRVLVTVRGRPPYVIRDIIEGDTARPGTRGQRGRQTGSVWR